MNKLKLDQLQHEHREYNKFLKQRHMPKISFDDYVDQIHGKVKSAKIKNDVYIQKTNVRYQDQKKYPSVNLSGSSVCARIEPKAYTGEQQLLGIATLHKSNMVPVFAKQDAEDIAKMRRN